MQRLETIMLSPKERAPFYVYRNGPTYFLGYEVAGEVVIADEWIPLNDEGDPLEYLTAQGWTVQPAPSQSLDVPELIEGLSHAGLAVFTFDDDDTEPQPANPAAADIVAGMAEAMGGPLATESEVARTADHIAARAAIATPGRERVQLVPSWRTAGHIIGLAIRNGNETGRDLAAQEVARMAAILDRLIPAAVAAEEFLSDLGVTADHPADVLAQLRAALTEPTGV